MDYYPINGSRYLYAKLALPPVETWEMCGHWNRIAARITNSVSTPRSMEENIDDQKTGEPADNDQSQTGDDKSESVQGEPQQSSQPSGDGEQTAEQQTAGLAEPRPVRPSQDRSKSSGTVSAPVEQLLTLPVREFLRFQDDMVNFMLFELEQTSREQSRTTSLTQECIDNMAETVATATMLPTEFLQQGVNPFRTPNESRYEENRARRAATEATEERVRSQAVRGSDDGSQVSRREPGQPQQPARKQEVQSEEPTTQQGDEVDGENLETHEENEGEHDGSEVGKGESDNQTRQEALPESKTRQGETDHLGGEDGTDERPESQTA